MTITRRAHLRDVMALAWSLYRAELNGPNPRTFADALAGAWRWTKRADERRASAPAWTRASGPAHVALRSMVQSPIRRAATGPYGETRARSLGYVTSMVGR